ncbi:unnamed protein product, partial [marine sediment metagenome]
MGTIVKERLEEEKLPFVIVENDEEKIEELKQTSDSLFIEGDAT